MVYRSRYLNRLMFSPPSYQGRFKQRELRFEPTWAGANAATNVTPQDELSGRAPYLASRELRDIASRCEKAITKGNAQIEDYEAFVICRQELTSRLQVT